MSAAGRVRRRLAAMLCETVAAEIGVKSFTITADALWSSRSPARYDDDTLGTWGGNGFATDHNGTVLGVVLGSYETMTECVTNGFWARWRGKKFSSGVDVTGKSRGGNS